MDVVGCLLFLGNSNVVDNWSNRNGPGIVADVEWDGRVVTGKERGVVVPLN